MELGDLTKGDKEILAKKFVDEVILRCGIWCVRPSEDMEFMKIMKGWARENDERNDEGKSLKINLQLHPPRWEKGDSNITTNTVGNLNLPLL